jgi:hypothetical protein
MQYPSSFQTQQSAPVVPPIQAIKPFEPSQIYYVNNMPYFCYPVQPEILYPMYPVYVPEQSRGVGDLVSNIGEIVEEVVGDKVNSLENYVKQMEQDAVDNATVQVKKGCFKICCM